MSLYRRNIINVCKNTSILPAEYQLVEFLESSGTQYISIPITTGIVSSLYCKYTSFSNASYQSMFGTWLSSAGGGICLQQSNSTSIRYWVNNYTIASANISMGTHEFEYRGGGIYVDDVFVASYVQSATAPDIDRIAFFARYQKDNNTYYPSSMRLCHFAISMGSVINAYPCYRKSDYVAGFYDVESNTFYTNAGSGTFIIGPDIAD